MSDARIRSEKARTRAWPIVGVVVSASIHVLVIASVYLHGELPDVGLEFNVPSEMEFGVVEGMDAVEATPAAVETPSETPSPSAPTQEGLGADAGPRRRDAGVPDSGLDGGVDGSLDASDADAQLSDDAGLSADAGPRLPPVARATEGRSRLGPGGDIALRLDFSRMRGTPLEASTAQFLSTVRDFQIVIGGSGLDPVHDLDQFLMGSPDPQDRQRFHYVGRLSRDEAWARELVSRLAASQGSTATWTEVDGIAVAPWRDGDDATAHRVLALLGDRYFVLCRQDELSRMLAWLAHQAEVAHRPASDGAAVALGVADSEIISVEMENVRSYLAASAPEVLETLPLRGRLSIVRSDARLNLAFRADFPDSASAVLGAEHWNVEREHIAEAPAVALLGFGRVISELVLSPDESTVRAQANLTSSQVITVLGLAQMQLERAYARWDHAPVPP